MLHAHLPKNDLTKTLPHWLRTGLCAGGVMLWVLSQAGCEEKNPQVRSSRTQIRTGGKNPQQPGPGYTEQSENAEDRAEAVRRVCTRKASSELPLCWSSEVERTKNRKFEARVGVMLTVTPQGRAEQVEVVSPQPELQQLEQCVADAARSWIFPEGTATALVRCDFFLRSSQ